MKEFLEDIFGSLILGAIWGTIANAAVMVVAIALKKEKWVEKRMAVTEIICVLLGTLYVYFTL